MVVSRKNTGPVETLIATFTSTLPSFVVKELQRIIAAVAYSKLPSKSCTVQKQEELLYGFVHGDKTNPLSMSQISQFVQGRGAFANAFDVMTGANSHDLLLKDVLTPGRDELTLITVGTGPGCIQEEVLKCATLPKKGKAANVLTGRTIHKQAMTVVANFRCAVAEGLKFLNSDGSLPSGTTKEDYYNFVRERMYHEMKGQTSKNGDPPGAAVKNNGSGGSGSNGKAVYDDFMSAENDCDGYEGKMPDDWIFDGYMAFVLFGPFGADEDKLDWLKHGTFYLCFIVSSVFVSLPHFFCLIQMTTERKRAVRVRARRKLSRKCRPRKQWERQHQATF
jgi:hypothetical protein